MQLVCDLSAGAQQQVDKALSLIGKKFKDLDLTNLYAPPPPPLTLPSLPMTSWVRMASPARTWEFIDCILVSVEPIKVQSVIVQEWVLMVLAY